MKIATTLAFALLLNGLLLSSDACLADHHPKAATAAVVDSSVVADESDDGWDDGWIELYNGKDFTGWKASENTDTFSIQDGLIVANGKRSHLFYVGDVAGAEFKNFAWECEVMLLPSSNSGMFFHTQYQETGWPGHGYEIQLNNTHRDRIKTGSVYAVQNVMDASPAEDNEWFTQRVVVQDDNVKIYVNGELVNEYTEPADMVPPEKRPNRRLSSGTIALQGHDPGSTAKFRRIRVKLLD
ncbi:MAG: DUF1080 domain-containing protein [Planctomycetota bacterium]